MLILVISYISEFENNRGVGKAIKTSTQTRTTGTRSWTELVISIPAHQKA